VKVLTAYYDLAVGPVSFDFVTFLIKAEIARRKAGADRLHMVIVPFARGVAGMFRDKTQLYDEHEMRWRLWNICIPGCSLLGASLTLATDWEQAKRLKTADVWPPDWDRQTLKDRRHLVGDIITAARAGTQIPMLQASTQARRKVREAYSKLGRKVVTVTLRHTYLRERNSDRAAWQLAMRHIEAKGFGVAVLEDTSVALSNGVGYGELNLDVRMACYQEAALNLQANNGASSLCWFSEQPYRMFGAGVPAEEWDGLFVKQGLPLGTTWPWAKPQQKVVYGQPSTEQIVAEFEEWASATS
jgi:hypothetical protein